ncbi:MAG: recombination protein RecO, partial [Campylobacterales bacterium]
MKGFILRTQLVREEDLIVEVLTPSSRLTLYRFYGARHPQLQVGYLIDFYPETPKNYPTLRLRHPIHLQLGFELSFHHLYWWQRFI